MTKRRIAGCSLALAFAISGATVSGQPAADALARQGAAQRDAQPKAEAAFTSLLPRGIRPLAYRIRIAPDPAALTFAGKAAITVEFDAPSSSLTLNALDLDIAKASLGGVPARIALDPKSQTATFTLAKPASAGRHELVIDYTGKIGTQASGLFALDYSDAGKAKRALYTQFEAPDARRMFPGWDEPAFKASFVLEADIADNDGLALSNMPAESRTPLGNGRTLVRFMPSPKMSSYLLFFALGDFERRTERVAGTEIGVVTKRGDLAKADFAMASAGETVAYFNDYFASPFPLPKLDHVAAPGRSQFFSAMENWGGIFYFEHAMLLDPRISSAADKQRVFEVVAHETAHQWFGDLVTMGWWDDLWLNEGFASWMEGKATERFHPEWNPALGAVGTREAAMGLDALASTHPILQPVRDPDAISQAFDAITYSKGEAVIRMLESYVGEAGWRDGVRAYVGKHAYGNTKTDDLWAAVETATGKPVTQIAHQFTQKSGVPMIRLASSRCAAGRTKVILVQEEFTLDRPDKPAERWSVPVTLSAGGEPQTLLVDGRAEASLAGCRPVVLNQGQKGYFRSLYDAQAFGALAQDYAKLAPADQLGLLADTWALGLGGKQDPTAALALVDRLPLDAQAELWAKSAEIMSTIGSYAKDDLALRGALARYASARLGPKLGALGWQSRAGELDTVSALRNTLIATLGDIGDAKVVAEARARFAQDAATPISGPQRKAILGVVATHADKPTWDVLRAMARNETAPLVRSQLYGLLAASDDPVIANSALELALTDEPSKTDAAAMISAVAATHPEMAFAFALAHGEQIAAKVDAGARSRYVVGLARRASDTAILPSLEAWAKANLPGEAYRAADTAIASIRYRTKVKRERLPALSAWLLRIPSALAPGRPEQPGSSSRSPVRRR